MSLPSPSYAGKRVRFDALQAIVIFICQCDGRDDGREQGRDEGRDDEYIKNQNIHKQGLLEG
jgi:hypothetical protein